MQRSWIIGVLQSEALVVVWLKKHVDLGWFTRIGIPPKSSIDIGCSIINHPASEVLSVETSIWVGLLNLTQRSPLIVRKMTETWTPEPFLSLHGLPRLNQHRGGAHEPHGCPRKLWKNLEPIGYSLPFSDTSGHRYSEILISWWKLHENWLVKSQKIHLKGRSTKNARPKRPLANAKCRTSRATGATWKCIQVTRSGELPTSIYLSIDLSIYLSIYLSKLIQSSPIQSNLI